MSFFARFDRGGMFAIAGIEVFERGDQPIRVILTDSNRLGAILGAAPRLRFAPASKTPARFVDPVTPAFGERSGITK